MSGHQCLKSLANNSGAFGEYVYDLVAQFTTELSMSGGSFDSFELILCLIMHYV